MIAACPSAPPADAGNLVSSLKDRQLFTAQNIVCGNALTSDLRPPQDVALVEKGKAYTGFLLPYLVVLDDLVGAKRWTWWLDCLISGSIPHEDPPRITFTGGATFSERGRAAMKHLLSLIDHLGQRVGYWKALETLVDWVLWGLGLADYPEIADETHDYLYRTFNLGLLIQEPHDYLATIIADRKGNRWNPTAFYPTPHTVCEAMAKMTLREASGKGPFDTVMEPAAGTGRMLLHASNHTFFLFGIDIDPMMVKCCRLNLALYAPWGSLPAVPADEAPYYAVPGAVALAAMARLSLAEMLRTEGFRHLGIGAQGPRAADALAAPSSAAARYQEAAEVGSAAAQLALFN